MGIERDERRRANRAWLPVVRRLLGKVGDREIARRVGVTAQIVTRARTELGIAATLKPSAATSGTVGDRLRAMSKAKVRRVLAGLDPIDAKIIEARYLRKRPVTLAVLGKELGISRQRIAQRELRAVAAILRR